MNRIALFLLAIAVFAYVVSASSSTSTVIYSDRPKSPPAFLSGTFNISWPTEASICALQDLGSGSASWIIGSTAPTTDSSYRSVGCGIFTSNNNVNLTGYSDLEFYARLAIVDNAEQPVHQLTYINVLIELQDSDGNKAPMTLKITDQLTRFILPLDNFKGINKAQIHGVLLITILEITNYQHVRYLAIDSARFNNRTAYKVFADAISISREAPSGPSILYNWVEDGANTTGCDPNYGINYAPEGVKVMNVPQGTWGCGLNNIPLNLGRAVSLKFNLKSKTGVKIEIMDFQGNKAGVSLNSTKGVWQTITLPVTQFTGVDMTQLSWPFMITREADNTDAVLWFDNVRYSFI